MAILQGSCLNVLPPRLSEQGRPYYAPGNTEGGGIVVVSPRANVTVGGDGVSVRVGPRSRHDHDHDEDDDDNDHDEDENEAAPQSPEQQQAYDQRVWESFKNDRAGTSLGCMVATDGELCAAKKGCGFFNSCCASLSPVCVLLGWVGWVELAFNSTFQSLFKRRQTTPQATPAGPAWAALRATCSPRAQFAILSSSVLVACVS